MAWFQNPFIAPELEIVQSLDDRSNFASEARRRARFWQRPAGYAGLFAVVFLLLIICWPALTNIVRQSGWSPLLLFAFTAAWCSAVGTILLDGLRIRAFRRNVRAILNERGYPVCMTCGYNIAGLESRHCPECGLTF